MTNIEYSTNFYLMCIALILLFGSHFLFSLFKPLRMAWWKYLGRKNYTKFQMTLRLIAYYVAVIAFCLSPSEGQILWDFSSNVLIQILFLPFFLVVMIVNLSVQGGAAKDPTNIAQQMASGDKKHVVPTGSTYGWNRVTRHPTWWSLLLLFSMCLVLFPVNTSLLILASAHILWLVVGMIHQDKRIRQEMDLEGYFKETSFWPFVAILQKRNRFVFGEIKPLGLGVGVFSAAIFFVSYQFESTELALIIFLLSRAVWMIITQMIIPVLSYRDKVGA